MRWREYPQKGRFLHHSYILMLEYLRFFVNEERRKVHVFCVQNEVLLHLTERIFGEGMFLQKIRVRFLEKGEEARLPKGAKMLPKPWRKAYIEHRKPYYLEGDTAVIQTTAENSLYWRKQTAALLEKLKQEGTEVIIPPAEGELPKGILPFADGKRMMYLFAFAGAAEALRRQGKNPAECRYLLAGGNAAAWRSALISMDHRVNHLAIFTADVREAKEAEEELFREWGLVAEVFASPKHPALGEADVVFGCGMEQRKYEHMLKKDALWFDLAGNRPVLRRLMEHRPDVTVVDQFFFRREKRQMEGGAAEAEAFLACPIFRENWKLSPEEAAGKEISGALQEMGYAVSGFSLLGKRVKIMRKP